MSKRSDKLLIKDILESIKKIYRFTENIDFHSFLNDEKTGDAVTRNFEIIGEASKKISEEIKNKFSQIPWKKLNGFRNKIVHDYFGVDLGILWKIKEKDLPQLETQLTKVIKYLEDNDNINL